ncbi:two-component system sensor histidine kinase DesK [Actinomadura pelletieri DSM 43383]|uniref:Two-component system sensor histidine kinase DesK n=2 Tax=Actinomadura pelletieri TaxID=111805 RepID=A0A495QY49_9ACTN|nr:two-component system sensor histidine kinase DesK [Actinomadura pelletieri DSM 43383]
MLQTRLVKQAETGPSHMLLSATVVIFGIFAVQWLLVLYGPRSQRPRRWVIVTHLATQTALALLPLLVFGNDWYPVVGGFLAGSMLLLLRPPLSWFMVALVTAGEGLLRYYQGWSAVDVTFCVVATVNTGIAMYAITRLSGFVRELHATRAQFAAAAAARERLEAAGSLRAVLGAALTRVEELSRRARDLLPVDPAAARDDLDEVARTSRQAATDVRSIVGALQGPSRRRERPGRVTQSRLAWTILVIMTVGFAGEQVMNVHSGSGGSWRATAAAVAVAAAISALMLRHTSALLRRKTPRFGAWTLAAQVLLVFVPFALFGPEWATMACLATGSVLLVSRGRRAWIMFALTIAAWCVPALWASHGLLFYVYTCAISVQIGVVVYALYRLPMLAREVDVARERLARMAALHERLRISRDVHDLLGLGLSTITVKAELARRLVSADPVRAAEELGELADLAERSRAEAHAVAADDRALSLRDEAVSARAALAAAGADVHVALPDETDLPPSSPVDGVLAAVLRESVTNVLRHAHPEHCAVTVVAQAGVVRLTVHNDGVIPPSFTGSDPGSGKGLSNLTARTGALGGSLSAGTDGKGGFTLVAEVPLTAGTGTREVPRHMTDSPLPFRV